MERLRLFVAVVVRGELASRIDGLRLALGSAEIGRSSPHVTLVPPFNVAGAGLSGLLGSLRSVGESQVGFACTLGPVAMFDRESPVVYLAVADQTGRLGQLAVSCRRALGPLPMSGERHPFVPHVTIANRVSRPVADATRTALGAFGAMLEVEALSLLQLDPADPERRWLEIADFPLAPPVVRGRGGLEIALTLSRLVDPESCELLGLGGPPADAVPGEPWAAVGRTADGPVAVARGSVAGGTATIEALVVAPPVRRMGYGSRLVEFVETMAVDRALQFVTAIVATEEEERYFAGRGYRALGSVPDGRTLVHKAIFR